MERLALCLMLSSEHDETMMENCTHTCIGLYIYIYIYAKDNFIVYTKIYHQNKFHHIH